MKKKKSVYLLEAYSFESCAKHPDVPKVDVNGDINTDTYDLGIYSSIEQAQKTMKIWAADRNRRGEEVFMGGFILTEKSVDGFADNKYNIFSEFESIRSYDVNGVFNCACDCDDGGKKPFTGRDVPVKLHPGDLAVSVCKEKSYVFMVGASPYTKTEWMKKLSPAAVGDATDDCYLGLCAKWGHSHPMSPYVFPFSWAIPDKLQKKLDSAKIEYYDS